MADLQIAQILGLDYLPIGPCRFDPAECAKQEAIAQGVLAVRAAAACRWGWPAVHQFSLCRCSAPSGHSRLAPILGHQSVDNPDHDDGAQDERPIGNLSAGYRGCSGKPVHKFSSHIGPIRN